MVEYSVMVWRITPPSQLPQERTFFRGTPHSFQVMWTNFVPAISLTYVSRNLTSFTTSAEFIAIPELDGTEFMCSGASSTTVVLHIAS